MEEIVLTKEEFNALVRSVDALQESLDQMRATNAALKQSLRTIIHECGLSDVIPIPPDTQTAALCTSECTALLASMC